MNTVVPIRPDTKGAELIESVIIRGDLSTLTAEQRADYYLRVCESVGLNPVTKPFEFITLNNKLVLYALKSATEQLRTKHNISVTELVETEREGVFIVTAKVANADGRTDAAKGAVNIANLKGEALANALMKAETKAKRRATLSICGLGLLDETEIEDIPAAAKAPRVLKKDTRELYHALQAEMDTAASSIENLNTWGKGAAERVKQLPADWQLTLSSLYQAKLAALKEGKTPDDCGEMLAERWGERHGGSMAREHPMPQHDADGVIWEEAGERPATTADIVVEPSAARAIVVEEIKAAITLHVEPTNERRKVELLQTHFKATSWTEVANVLPIERLKDGFDTMTFTLTGKNSKYHQDRMARSIDHTDVNGTPAFLRRTAPKEDAQPFSQAQYIAALAAE